MYEMLKELIGEECVFTLANQFPQSGTLVDIQGKLAKIEVGKHRKIMYLNMENVLSVQPKDVSKKKEKF